MKTKKEKIKHDHSLTCWLKGIIFAAVMLAPFFAILMKCWYVANNRNAVESYRGTYQYTEVLELNAENYVYDENAYINTNALKQGNYGYIFKISQIKNVSGDINEDYLFIASYKGQGLTLIKIYNTMPNYLTLTDIGNPSFHADTQTETNNLVLNTGTFRNNYQINLTFNYIGSNMGQYININTQIDFSNVTYSTDYNSLLYNFVKPKQYNYVYDSSLSSAFYSAIQELDKASIFTWTTDTALYTAINDMCNILGIVSPPLAVLLTYWTLISIVYVIIDIVLETFIFITHWFNDKMV